jgi:hypothetical protein
MKSLMQTIYARVFDARRASLCDKEDVMLGRRKQTAPPTPMKDLININ